MFKMTRTFHPVGQGAFYTEKFELDNGENCNIVYDCGTLEQCGFFKGMLGVIDKAFSPEECIDGIFISHFDADHVNGFPHLIKRVKNNVKHVFLPHLTKEEILLCLLEKGSKQGIVDEDLKNAKAYVELVSNKNASEILQRLGIGEGRDGFPKIHLVLAGSNQDREEREFSIAQENGSVDIIPSGEDVCQRVFVRDGRRYGFLLPWCFIPYNLDAISSDKCENLKRILEEEPFKNKDVKDILSNKDDLGVLKKKYVKVVSKEINENSMTLYSGPCCRVLYSACPTPVTLGEPGKIVRVGCLYTGDFNMEYEENGTRGIELLLSAYGVWIPFVGCVQLPHHGSEKNYNPMLGNLDAVFVACYGMKNNFGHPGPSVIYHLGSLNKSVCLVTEKSSAATQVMGMKFYDRPYSRCVRCCR